jgi:hypothetical protein
MTSYSKEQAEIQFRFCLAGVSDLAAKVSRLYDILPEEDYHILNDIQYNLRCVHADLDCVRIGWESQLAGNPEWDGA